MVALGAGSGAGFVKAQRGVGPSNVPHLTLELGYFVTPRVSLSLQAREQIPLGGTRDWTSALTTALTALGRVTYWLGQGPLLVKLSVFAGNGTYQHEFTAPCSDRRMTCAFVEHSGDKVAGLGAGLSYALGPRLALTGGLDLAAAVPNVMFHADLTLGVSVRF
jgi:hypothetical protein